MLLSPRMLGAHLLALVCVASAGLLGYWQYDAWQQRRADEQVDRTQLDPVSLGRRDGARRPVPGRLRWGSRCG